MTPAERIREFDRQLGDAVRALHEADRLVQRCRMTLVHLPQRFWDDPAPKGSGATRKSWPNGHLFTHRNPGTRVHSPARKRRKTKKRT